MAMTTSNSIKAKPDAPLSPRFLQCGSAGPLPGFLFMVALFACKIEPGIWMRLVIAIPASGPKE